MGETFMLAQSAPSGGCRPRVQMPNPGWVPRGVYPVEIRVLVTLSGYARKSASSSTSIFLGRAPTMRFLTSPSLYTMSVGMLMTSYWWET